MHFFKTQHDHALRNGCICPEAICSFLAVKPLGKLDFQNIVATLGALTGKLPELDEHRGA